MRSTLALVVLGAFGCADGAEPEPSEQDCAEGEVWVEDACLQCGEAGGCDEQGPACRPVCEDCPDGYEPMLCL